MKGSIGSVPICIFACFVLSHAAHLPSFFVPCNLTDPELNKCGLESGRNGLQQLLKGVKSLKIPNMLPLEIPKITIDSGPNLKISLSQVKIHGMDSVEFIDFRLDPKTKKSRKVLHFKQLIMVGQYEIQGNILLLSIQGQGESELKIDDADLDFSMDLETFEKEVVVYAKIKNPSLKYMAKRIHFHFSNLFNGDEQLGTRMNEFLNENWEEVNKEISPSVSEALGKIIEDVINKFITQIPFNEMFIL